MFQPGREDRLETPREVAVDSMTGLAQSGRRLGPPEDLLDTLTPPAADGVTGMAGGAAVNRRAPIAGVLGDMRCGVALAQRRDEAGAIQGPPAADDPRDRQCRVGGAVAGV